jgi:hypothetical protein
MPYKRPCNIFIYRFENSPALRTLRVCRQTRQGLLDFEQFFLYDFQVVRSESGIDCRCSTPPIFKFK